MLFNSYAFLLVFLPVAFAGFFLLARVGKKAACAWLAMASLCFYAYGNLRYLPLLTGSIALNFLIGRSISGASQITGKRVLAGGIILNLTALGVYKYANGLVGIWNMALHAHIASPDIALPPGISFFTFTQIAFLVDAYKRKAREYSVVHYGAFVSYFPHLIAGPILHHAQFIPQLENPATYRPQWRKIAVGMTFLAIGLAKKTLLADSFASYATLVFTAADSHATLGFYPSWIGALSYSFQIYFDFSGYCDMAIGISLLFGIMLPFNFNSPYKATSLIDFWRRWHMTLSAFLREYLYIPLGGNRKGPLRRYANLMATMLLGGMWHGASWTFLLWGGVHGLLLALNHLLRLIPLRLPALLRWLASFLCIVATWVIFRAEHFGQIQAILSGMADFSHMELPAEIRGSFIRTYAFLRNQDYYNFIHYLLLAPAPKDYFHADSILLILAGFFIVTQLPNSQQCLLGSDSGAYSLIRLTWSPSIAWGILTGLLISLSSLFFWQSSVFLYFRF